MVIFFLWIWKVCSIFWLGRHDPVTMSKLNRLEYSKLSPFYHICLSFYCKYMNLSPPSAEDCMEYMLYVRPQDLLIPTNIFHSIFIKKLKIKNKSILMGSHSLCLKTFLERKCSVNSESINKIKCWKYKCVLRD